MKVISIAAGVVIASVCRYLFVSTMKTSYFVTNNADMTLNQVERSYSQSHLVLSSNKRLLDEQIGDIRPEYRFRGSIISPTDCDHTSSDSINNDHDVSQQPYASHDIIILGASGPSYLPSSYPTSSSHNDSSHEDDHHASSAGHETSVSIYNALSSIKVFIGSICVIIIVGSVLLVEEFFDSLDRLTKDTPFQELSSAIERELMIVGTMAFLFKMILNLELISNHDWILALEYADLLVPITSFVFCIEGVFLIYMSIKQCEIWSRSYRLVIIELLDRYFNAYSVWFNENFTWFPWSVENSEMEFRIFHILFCDQYHIQRDAFAFDEYVERVFEKVLLNMITIRPIDWLIVIFFVLLNWARNAAGIHIECSGSHTCSASSSIKFFTMLGALIVIMTVVLAVMSRIYELRLLHHGNVTCGKDYVPFLKAEDGGMESSSEIDRFTGTDLRQAISEAKAKALTEDKFTPAHVISFVKQSMSNRLSLFSNKTSYDEIIKQRQDEMNESRSSHHHTIKHHIIKDHQTTSNPDNHDVVLNNDENSSSTPIENITPDLSTITSSQPVTNTISNMMSPTITSGRVMPFTNNITPNAKITQPMSLQANLLSSSILSPIIGKPKKYPSYRLYDLPPINGHISSSILPISPHTEAQLSHSAAVAALPSTSSPSASSKPQPILSQLSNIQGIFRSPHARVTPTNRTSPRHQIHIPLISSPSNNHNMSKSNLLSVRKIHERVIHSKTAQAMSSSNMVPNKIQQIFFATSHGKTENERSKKAIANLERGYAVDLGSVFLFDRPDFYFESVKFLMMIMSFYLALWITNFLSSALNDLHSATWVVISLLPCILSFTVFIYVVKCAALLKAVLFVDHETMEETMEQTETSQQLAHTLRRKVVAQLEAMGEGNPETELFNLYHMMDHSGSNALSRKEFQMFLEAMGITFSRKRWQTIFRNIDRDYDNQISFEELVLFVFPDHKSATAEENKRLKAAQNRVNLKMQQYARSEQQFAKRRANGLLSGSILRKSSIMNAFACPSTNSTSIKFTNPHGSPAKSHTSKKIIVKQNADNNLPSLTKDGCDDNKADDALV